MVKTGSRHRLACCAVLIALLSAPTAASGQAIVPTGLNLVSVRASETPLISLIKQIAAVRPFAVLRIDPRVEQRLVTLSLDAVSVPAALAAILEAAGVDYALAAGDSGAGMRLIAGEGGSGAPAGLTDPVRASDAMVVNSEMNPEPPDVVEPPPVEHDVDAEQRKRMLEEALAPPALPGRRDVVALPFPGPDGAALMVPVDRNAPPQPRPGLDRRQRELEAALAPRPKPVPKP